MGKERVEFVATKLSSDDSHYLVIILKILQKPVCQHIEFAEKAKGYLNRRPPFDHLISRKTAKKRFEFNFLHAAGRILERAMAASS